ncbi:PQQ-dependent sugar dehydrogenase [Erythrobacter sp. MTPC3]|uniref:PQQ-dependent sugar dehydrogenase n=1 Tax=Erythrobacter sp. MTPC3 TaxID=3056564 RepID=UPI0036F2028B
MTKFSKLPFILSLSTLALASCAMGENVDSADAGAAGATADVALSIDPMGEFNEPWAIEFAPGTNMLFITEKSGALKFIDTAANDGAGRMGSVSGVPEVAYGGQGGLGDIVFLESEAGADIGERTVYLSWAEMGDGGTRGAAVGRGTLSCAAADACAISGLEVIWRQAPKVEGRGQYSHRISVSPDEQHLFIASGDRKKQTPAQDTTNTLGSIVRLNLDGTPAEGNPMADQGGVTAQIWSYGHRNILGMDFDSEGRLWEIEHGPAGGDELNLVKEGQNYGWPTRSYGENYNGDPIPDHTEDDGFAKPAAHWTPVIAPGDMIIYSGDMFGPWQGDAIIAGLVSQGLVRVELDGETAAEAERYDMGARIRSVEEGPDGSIWIAEDGPEGRILKLSAQ